MSGDYFSLDRLGEDVKARRNRVPSAIERVAPMSSRGESHAHSHGHALPGLREWPPDAGTPAHDPDALRVWVIDLDTGLPPGGDVDATEPGPELAILSDDERARAARFVRARDRRRFARCRAALREILGATLGEPPGSLRFRSFAKGKPELDRGPGALESLRFNVSHSDNLALIAVSQGREVGVDLERLRPVSEAERIVASFFTAAEQEAFAAIPEPGRTSAFLRGWTRKEAVLKGLGMGISGLASRHETGFGTSALTTGFTPARPASRVDRWLMWEAAPRPGFVAALAVDVGDPPLLAREIADGSLPATPPKP
jgi:4'-phosphopantetheinyl transferase